MLEPDDPNPHRVPSLQFLELEALNLASVFRYARQLEVSGNPAALVQQQLIAASTIFTHVHAELTKVCAAYWPAPTPSGDRSPDADVP